MEIFQEETKKTKHKLASIWKRSFARIFDYMFLMIISFLFFIICFIGQYNQLFSNWNSNASHLDTWRVCLATCFATFLIFFYFYIIPYVTKGYTIFKKIFKIRLYSNERYLNFFWLIFKHEFLLSFFPIIFNIILIIIIGISNDPISVTKFISSINFNEDFINSIKNNYAIAIPSFIVKIGYIFSGFLPMFLFFYMWFNKNKKSLQDKMSNTIVYELQEYKPNITINQQEKKQNNLLLAPGLNIAKNKEKQINNNSINNKDDFLMSCENRSLLKNFEERKKQIDNLKK